MAKRYTLKQGTLTDHAASSSDSSVPVEVDASIPEGSFLLYAGGSVVGVGSVPTVPTRVTKDSAVAGTSSAPARADHKHDVATAAPGRVAVGDKAAEGSASSLARSDHKHELSAPEAPVAVTRGEASAGTSETVARSDHKHDVSTGVPGAIKLGDSSKEGVASTLARSDHVHAFVAPIPPTSVTKSPANTGVSPAAARCDHKHDVVTAAPPKGIGAANSEGTSSSLARADHDHTLRTTTGPTDLALGAIADGEFLQRVGATLVGGMPPRGRVAAMNYLIQQLGDRTLLNRTAAQPMFDPAYGALVLETGKSFIFQLCIHIAGAGGVEHSSQIGFGGTVSISSIRYKTMGIRTTMAANVSVPHTPFYSDVNTPKLTGVCDAGNAADTIIWAEGVIRTSGAGTLAPQLGFSEPPSVTKQLLDGGYLLLRELGSDMTEQYGGWVGLG